MPGTAFPVDPELTAIAIAYKNPDVTLIADSVLPRGPVSSTLFQYTRFNDEVQAFTLPHMRQGPRSKVNRIDLSGVRVAAEVDDNGIACPLSFYDTQTTGKGVNARQLATEFLTSLVLLQREVDVASLVFDADTYPADNKVQLTGNDQFSDTDSDPIGTIQDGLDAALVRPNVLVFGQLAWRYFRMHADVMQAVHGNEGTKGMASRQQIADLFEVQEVLVGTGIVNLAKPGATASMARVWGPHVAAIYRDRAAAAAGGLTFGWTAEFGTRVAGTYPDPEVGIRGGEVCKVGETTKPLVCAPRAAFFWEDAAVAPSP
jgi:hypothetical protein